jgi:hypothetical protein
MKKISVTVMLVCLTVLFCGVAAAEETVTAIRSPQRIYIDGQAADLLAYSIGGNNYIRLRDLGKAVDFSVFYDASANSVGIDRGAAYADGTDEALPIPGNTVTAVLSKQPVYVRGNLVNMTAYTIADNNYMKLRDVARSINLGLAYDPKSDSVYIDRLTAYLANMEPHLLRPEAIPKIDTPTETPTVTIETPTTDGEIIVPERWKLLPEEYRAVYPFLTEINAMSTDTAKVNAIIRYVCERIIYGEPDDPEIYSRKKGTSESMRYAMFLDPPQVQGVCSHYAKAVYLLCVMTNIPCTILRGDNHDWNAVYVDGEWLYADATNDDLALAYRGKDYNLLFPMDEYRPFKDGDPEGTKEWMEQKVPGSTK